MGRAEFRAVGPADPANPATEGRTQGTESWVCWVCWVPGRGSPWKRLNDEVRQNYDRAVEHVLGAIEKAGGDRREVEAEVDRIMAQIVGRRLE